MRSEGGIEEEMINWVAERKKSERGVQDGKRTAIKQKVKASEASEC